MNNKRIKSEFTIRPFDTIEEFTVTFAVQYYTIGLNVNDAPDPSQAQVPATLS